MRERQLLIIGSSGQIGSGLMSWCRKHGVQATGVDARPNPWSSDLTDAIVDFATFIPEGDRRYTDVVFLATEPSARRLNADPRITEKDVALFERAIEYAARWGARTIIVSSRELFGLDEDGLREFRPPDAYVAEKRRMETMLHDARRSGASFGIIRVPIVCGGFDGDVDRVSRLIPRWCDAALRGRPIEIDDPAVRLPFVAVDEVCDELSRRILADDASFVIEVRGDTVTLGTLKEMILRAVSDLDKKKEGGNPLESAIIRTLQTLSVHAS